jgi:hypothetical protein
VRPKHKVKCKWQAVELDGKTVEFELRSGKQTTKGQGSCSASDLGDGFSQIAITLPLDEKAKIFLTQAEADCIQTLWERQFRNFALAAFHRLRRQVAFRAGNHKALHRPRRSLANMGIRSVNWQPVTRACRQ